MKTKTFFKNSGLSLAELMVGMGLLSGVVLIVTQFSSVVKKELKSIEFSSEAVADKATAMKALNDDFLTSGPTYNYVRESSLVTQRDDFWTVTEMNEGSRTLKLEQNGQCIEFLSVDNGRYLTAAGIERRKSIIVSPSFFFYPRTSDSAKLSYDPSKLSKILSDNKLNSPNQVLKISGMVPYYDPAGFFRDFGILLSVATNGTTVPFTSTLKTYDLPSPSPNCLGARNNIDTFLRCLPSPGGGSTIVFITPVNHISYCFRRVNSEGGFRLIKKRNNQETIMATRVENLIITRKNSALPIIDLNLVFCKSNTNINPRCKPGV